MERRCSVIKDIKKNKKTSDHRAEADQGDEVCFKEK